MHICCNIDDKYARHCGVMLTSLFENNKQGEFEIHILTSSLNESNIERLNLLTTQYGAIFHFYKVDSKVLEGVKYRKNKPLSEAAYYRILLSSVLDSSISTVLYLDADIIVLGNVSPLFSIDLEGYALAATKDLAVMRDEIRFDLPLSYDKPYFCSGIMLINLDFWRENNSEEKLIAYSKLDHQANDHDQGALNAVFKDNWLMLAPKWGRCFPVMYPNTHFINRKDRCEFDHSPIILHYVYIKPWNKVRWFGIFWNRYWNCYYRYLKLSPWKDVKLDKLVSGRFGLYKYVLVISIKFTVINIFNAIGNFFYYHFEDVIFYPFTVLLDLMRKLRLTKNSKENVPNGGELSSKS